jgi:hypothetical protein
MTENGNFMLYILEIYNSIYTIYCKIMEKILIKIIKYKKLIYSRRKKRDYKLKTYLVPSTGVKWPVKG